MLAIKILAFTLLIPGTVTVLIPYCIVTWDRPLAMPELSLLTVAGGMLVIVGFATYASCAWNFGRHGRGTPAPIDPPKTLVVRGLYRFTRNPMYIGVLSVLIGESALFRSAPLVAFATVMFLCFQSFIVLYEEPKLHSLFGASYDEYRRTVPRWIGPRRPK